nr:ankyrin repeat domain-containing protein [Chryseobacterium arachidis]
MQLLKMNIYQTDYKKTPEIFTLIKEKKNDDAIRYLKQNPSEIFLKGWMDNTPLHIASLNGNFEMVKYLVENGAEVNAERSGKFATPLCWADNLEIAQFLLDHGATMNEKELDLATNQDKFDIVDLLLSEGAKIDLTEPQYLECKSIQCIKIYLKHNIEIDGCNNFKSNLLHKLSWLDLPEVFDFAYNNGCPWQEDIGGRTPYYVAKQGRRENILKHFKEKYSDLISHQIVDIPIDHYEFERIFFLKQSLISPNCFIGLTVKNKLIKYVLENEELRIDRIAAIDISHSRNFSFDKNDNIVIPTADNKLLIVDQITFRLLNSVELENGLDLDQIEYLPLKKIFIGSSQNRKLVLLSEDYKVIKRSKAEYGTIRAKISKDNSLVSFLSYDQETFYTLYKIDDDLNITYIDSFFKDWNNASCGFSFHQNDFAVSFPYVAEYYSFKKRKLKKHWEIDISKYQSQHNHSCVSIINDNTIIVGKGKILLMIDIFHQTMNDELTLDLSAEIKDLYLDQNKENLIVSTDRELRVISLREKTGCS